MKLQIKKQLIFLALLLPAILFSCSQENYSWLAVRWHNLNARDNAYFLAREKLKEVDAKIWLANVDDYNKVLKVYPTLDDQIMGSIKGDLEDIIKKAALPVTRHKNSDWVDDSYNVIGIARLYQGEITLAQETFKFVNYKSKDPNDRHEALNQLMRTFIENKEYENATAVFNVLKKEKLTPKNERTFLLLRAYYYTQLEEYQKAEPYLTLALPLIKKKDFKARIHFIVAQIDQMFENNKEAFANYHSTIKKNPPYELTFYAKLYRTQVSSLGTNEEKQRLLKYYKKLLKDRKNEEYKDKIYYEMGIFELKQGHNTVAIQHFKNSLKQPTKNTFQKANTFYKLARVYYDTLQDYENAKIYYDSTVATWDKSHKDYKIILARQKVLEEFVKHLRVVRREDSLQRLAKMDSVTLDGFLRNLIKVEEKKAKEEEKRLKEEQAKAERIAFNKKNSAASPALPATMINDPFSGQAKWYFQNPTMIANGEKAFQKTWGQRPLEDNWRRATKERPANFDNDTKVDTVKSVVVAKVVEKSPEEIISEKINVYKQDIPFTEAMLTVSNGKLEDALYNLGKIYYLKLNEITNAEKVYIRHSTAYVDSEDAPEILYYLYIIANTQGRTDEAEKYKDIIFSKYAQSIYAKLIRNPNYLNDAKIANQQAAIAYKEAYGLFKNEQYFAADSLAKLTNLQFVDNDINDRLVFLQILVTGKTKNELQYKAELEKFVATYNTSKLVETAKNNIKITDEFIKSRDSSGVVSDSNSIRYKGDLEQEHYVIIASNKSVAEKVATNLLKFFINKNSPGKKLETENFVLNDTTKLTIVKAFVDKNAAKLFMIEAKNDNVLINNFANLPQSIYIISKANMVLLKKSKYLVDYQRFYLDKY